jgi:hypothetical protein
MESRQHLVDWEQTKERDKHLPQPSLPLQGDKPGAEYTPLSVGAGERGEAHMCRLFYLTIILKLVTHSFPAVFSLQNREV